MGDRGEQCVFVKFTQSFNRYDLTTYIQRHPPGPGMIIGLAQKGRDAKGMYGMHSRKAREIWESYKIGTLENESS